MNLPNENAPGQEGILGNYENKLPSFCYPSPATVKGRTLGALLRGERLTHLDCWKRFGSARLSHHVYVLRGDLGWPVQMIEQTVTTTDAGRHATIGVYFLSPEVIAAAGEHGQRFAEDCARIEAERRAA
ncbi:hypothetical protein [Sideroxydans sp. CL21]|uniref:hypothetical protein n=1 Tax=Sideroxydans sp. CL21 TaxID=2600596 RepID=UPI0024BD26B3|nr:hypothetical protein [Sideroxydans sp. CL21]